MSTSAKQHLKVWVSDAAATEPTVQADGTVLDTSIVTAGSGLPLGGITFRTNLGLTTVRDDATASTTKDFQIIYKDLDGEIYFHDVKQADIVSAKAGQAAAAPTEQVSNLTVGTATEGASYVIKLEVLEYGGMIGAQDSAYFYGMHTASATDTVTTIGTALYNSLKLAVDKAPVAFAAVTNPSAGKVTVTGLGQPYTQALFSGRQVNFKLSLSSPEALVAGDDGDTTVPDPGNGNYNQVAKEEEFFAGYGSSYKDRQANWPAVTQPTLVAASGQLYTCDSWIIETKYGDQNSGTQRQVLKLYYQE